MLETGTKGGGDMGTAVATPKITLKDFLNLKPLLEKRLLSRLKDEIENNVFDNPPEGDLWELPTVDSKTVVKLSPLVETETGIKIKSEWVKRGGYDNIEEAISDLISKIEKACQEN